MAASPTLPGNSLRRPAPLALALGGLLVVLAIGLRFVALDLRPAMHDESMFAYYAWQYFADGRYTHQPILHGPVQMLGIGAFYHLFGDTTAVARGFIASCSLVLLLGGWFVMPRRYRWAGGLLLITSPTILYYSRYLHEEIIFNGALLVALAGLARQRTAGWRGPLWAVLGPVGVLFLLAVKINAVFVYAAGLTFLLAWAGVRVCWPRELPPKESPEAPAPAAPAPRSVAAPPQRKGKARGAAGPLAPAASASRKESWWQGALARMLALRPRPALALGWAAGTLLGLVLLVVLFGHLAQPTAKTPETAQLYTRLIGPDVVEVTPPGEKPAEPSALAKATWNICASWSYWLGQHKLHRIEGAIHYYLPLLVVYELPVLLALLVGLGLDGARNLRRAIFYATWPLAWLLLWSVWRGLPREGPWQKLIDFLHIEPNGSMLVLGLLISVILPWALLMLRERRTLAGWLGWWCACSLFQYSSAGEKVPWLVVHISLPMILMLPWLWLPWLRRRGLAAHVAVGVAVLLATLIALRNDYYLLGPRAADPHERIVYNHTTPPFDAYCKALHAYWTRPESPVPPDRRRVQLVGDPGWPGVWYFHERFELVNGPLTQLDPGVDVIIATPPLVEPLLIDAAGNAGDPPGWRTIRMSLRDHWLTNIPTEDVLGRWWRYYWWRETWDPQPGTFPIIVLEHIEPTAIH